MSLAVKSARFQAVGDPGLFSSIGKFLGGAAKVVGGILPGPVGLAAKFAGGLLTGGPQIQPRAPRQFVGPPRPAGIRGGQFVGPPRPAPAAAQVGPGIACPAGFRPNKSSYFLNDGTFVEKNTRCVRIRRRNPANSRATDRAIGRIESAKKMASRLGRITIRKECPGK